MCLGEWESVLVFVSCVVATFFFFFKQETAYDMRISDWSSDVCSSDLHHPDVFCAALLNAQPMGFYAPAQIVSDARKHGVEVRPVSINDSHWDCTLEIGRASCRERVCQYV